MGENNVIVITPADPPTQEFYPWGLDTIHVPDVHQEVRGPKGSGVMSPCSIQVLIRTTLI